MYLYEFYGEYQKNTKSIREKIHSTKDTTSIYIHIYMLAWCVVCKTYKCLVMKIN